MDSGMSTRFIVVICLGLFLAGGVNVYSQTVAPPPGFAPGQGDESPPSPLSEARIYSGHGNYSNPYNDLSADDDSNVIGGPFRPPAVPRRVRTFRTPPETVLLTNDEPAMPRVWFRGEAIYWWSKSSPLPTPLVTQGNPADSIPGAIGQPGTSILIGNQNVNLPAQGGGRFTFGFTFDAEQTWGAEASYMFLSNVSVSQSVSSNGSAGSPLLAFPFNDPTVPGESASLISSPGNYAGFATVTTQSLLQGVDLNILHNQYNSNGIRVDFLGGFRNVDLREDVNFQTQSPNVGDPFSFYNTFDEFKTNNTFYGGQVGARASYDVSHLFFMNATTKLAFGEMFENVSINGGTFTNIGGGFSSANGAYLTNPSNIGSMTRNQFAVIPELNLNFGIRLRPWASIIVGYSFLYISSVARPGEQIDRVINSANSPAIGSNFSGSVTNPARPSLSVTNTDFWAQGLNFALEIRF